MGYLGWGESREVMVNGEWVNGEFGRVRDKVERAKGGDGYWWISEWWILKCQEKGKRANEKVQRAKGDEGEWVNGEFGKTK